MHHAGPERSRIPGAVAVFHSAGNAGGSGGATIELRHLRYFVAVAEERHFGRAAQRLGIAQPGVSQQVMALERQIGVPLLLRNRHGAELTPAGEALLHDARRLLELVDQTIENVRSVGSGRTGVLRVGVPPTGVRQPAMKIIEAFTSSYPEAELQLHPGFIPQNVAAVQAHRLDVAFVLAPFDAGPNLWYQPLGERELLLAVPDGHRLACYERVPRHELLNETFLDRAAMVNPALARYLRSLLFGEEGHPRLQEVLDVGEMNRLLLVAVGRGITLATPPEDEELTVPGITLRRLEEPAPRVQCGFAWADGPLSPVTEAFLGVALGFVSLEPLRTAGIQQREWDGPVRLDKQEFSPEQQMVLDAPPKPAISYGTGQEPGASRAEPPGNRS
ncbi:MAG: LysR family transcriptional regulator [Actinomycetota bacterium]